VAPVKEVIYTYVYCEDEGDKGSNNVTSLLHQYLDKKHGLDSTKPKKKLSIVMDNCLGQNETIRCFVFFLGL
jgi:hypothetical protein